MSKMLERCMMRFPLIAGHASFFAATNARRRRISRPRFQTRLQGNLRRCANFDCGITRKLLCFRAVNFL
jgi:hypothetical protein